MDYFLIDVETLIMIIYNGDLILSDALIEDETSYIQFILHSIPHSMFGIDFINKSTGEKSSIFTYKSMDKFKISTNEIAMSSMEFKGHIEVLLLKTDLVKYDLHIKDKLC